MDELNQKLLPTHSKMEKTTQSYQARSKNRLTVMYERNKLQIDSVLDFQTWQNDKKLYRSIVEEPDFNWNSEEIMERELIMQQKDENILLPIETQNAMLVSNGQNRQRKSKSENIFQQKQKTPENKKQKQLNHYIFKLRKKTMKFIYYFNLVFNFMFRAGLVILVIFHIIGDQDAQKKQQLLFIAILLGLQGLVCLLYFLAITKMLYTKSDDISVYFQKQFYEKPYAEIMMQRILRKHFTFKKIIKNLCRLASPYTKFSKDIKIAVMRQQIYKRIELIIVFVPLFIVFILGTPWFDKSKQYVVKLDVQLLLAIVVSLQMVRLIFHYLLIYIFS